MTTQAMIVEDEHVVRQLLEIILRRAGLAVIPANNGEEALGLLEISHPDLIIIDVMMPGMDGVELCEHIRRNTATADIPVVIFSARTDQGSIDAAMSAGANAYLKKPIRPDDLITQINTFFVH